MQQHLSAFSNFRHVKSNILSSKRFQLNICNLSPDCRHGNAHAITLLTCACVSYKTFSDAVGVTILKLNLKVQELDQVELGFFIVKKKQNEYCDGYANLCESLTFFGKHLI